MRSLSVLFFSFVIATQLVSCGPSQRELAVKETNKAKQLCASGDTLKAIQKLDSIQIKYPKADVQISVAKDIRTEWLQYLIDSRNLQLIRQDSVIIALEKNFDKEKTEFDQYVQYNHKRQTFNRSWDRSFLQVHLDERGELYLSSNYMGKEWLEHTGIRVYDGELQAKSEKIPLDSPLNHRSDFLDYKWEKVSYMNGEADSVIHFIADNPDLNLKCVFLGKRYYYILLENYDVQAVVDALLLSKAIKRKANLEKEIADLKKKLKIYSPPNSIR
jgi:hypothetical protein